MPDKPKYYRSTFTWEGKRYERKSQKSQRDADRKADAHMTVKAWAREWLDVYKIPAIGESQRLSYESYLKNAIAPAIGSKRLKDVKDVDLQKIINARMGNSKSDLAKLRGMIKAMFRRAHASGFINKNPAEYLEIPAATDGTHRSITKEERAAVLDLAKTHYAGLWILIMLYCGLRPNECRALDWRHIDIPNKRIRVVQAMKAKTTVIDAPKSDAGVRNVPIPAVLLPVLANAESGPFEPVIVKPISKKRHTERSMASMWRNFKRELDIYMGATLKRNQITLSVVAPDLKPYCFRHTYCTDLQDKGIPINIAKYLMGHADIAVTSRVYTHTTADAIQSAADLIDGVAITVAQNPQSATGG